MDTSRKEDVEVKENATERIGSPTSISVFKSCDPEWESTFLSGEPLNITMAARRRIKNLVVCHLVRCRYMYYNPFIFFGGITSR